MAAQEKRRLFQDLLLLMREAAAEPVVAVQMELVGQAVVGTEPLTLELHREPLILAVAVVDVRLQLLAMAVQV
jgi:hypothetical protein